MKRYIPWMKLRGFELKKVVGMIEHENGDYVRYEDMRSLCRKLMTTHDGDVPTDDFVKYIIKEWE